MPRSVLVMFSQRGRLPASSLCSLGSLVFTADLLLEAFHTCGTTLNYGVHLALPAPRSGIPLCPYALFILLYISPICPSPLVYWLCHTFVVYQLDSSLIQAKASPLPLSLVPFLWALSPLLGIPLHWLDHGLQPHGLQPSDPCLPLAVSSPCFTFYGAAASLFTYLCPGPRSLLVTTTSFPHTDNCLIVHHQTRPIVCRYICTNMVCARAVELLKDFTVL